MHDGEDETKNWAYIPNGRSLFSSLLSFYSLLQRFHPKKKGFNASPFKMSSGPDESNIRGPSNITEQVAKDPTSKTDSTASGHPHHTDSEPKGDKVHFLHHQANPGPVILEKFDASQEGTKEERIAKAAAMNQ
jgi:hypothetical protein